MPLEPLQMAPATTALVPGQSVGRMALGASLHDVLTMIKEDRAQYRAVDLHYSQTDPLQAPVVVTLPENGIRLQFDGPDQRLRLIEITDFSKINLIYKGSELTKNHDQAISSRPAFKRIYQIFGASYPGEYIPSKARSPIGTYVLSWEGVAFNFPLQQSAWSPERDHVSLLGSHAASPASSLAVFEGASWAAVRDSLFVYIPSAPRQPTLTARARDHIPLPSEIDVANIASDGSVVLVRRSPAQPFQIVINETMLQDIITELGPADTTHKREERLSTPDAGTHRRRGSNFRPASTGRGSQPSSYSSTGTDTFDADFDSGDAEDEGSERTSREIFWCYFSHGFDILIGPPSVTTTSGACNGSASYLHSHLVVKKIILHGNVPGSYSFNRHRRLRWTIELPTQANRNTDRSAINSEAHFEQTVKPRLMSQFADSWPESDMARGKVVNRTWGAGPSDSSFFLPDAGGGGDGEDLIEGGGSEQWLGNTRLFSFPGFTFEVLENGAISALTVAK
ncbi:upf0183 protein [Acrodontium crateriforme]|uniref:Upf0183 protein n=1 Tax=Acrodontium crateriforme TaxID=150365 RepID=A0AAQ3LX31_9PEZI|nr:upf0183 protein [Acrodontium crateriforme]